MIEVWPAVLVAGATFAIGQFTVSNFVGPELTDALVRAGLADLGRAAARACGSRREEFTEGARLVVAAPARARHRRHAWSRAYATYGILIVTVLIGQIGNFAGMSSLKPPANVTALLKCGQGGNRLCPGSVGRTDALPPIRRASASPCGSSTGRAPTGSQDGKPAPLVQREPPVVAASSPYPLDLSARFPGGRGHARVSRRAHRVRADADVRRARRAPSARRSRRPSRSFGCRSSRSRSSCRSRP